VLDLLISFSLTIAFAHVSYFYFEKIFLGMKDRIHPQAIQNHWIAKKAMRVTAMIRVWF
jgi:hypothetical protein